MSAGELLARMPASPDVYPQKLDLVRACILLIQFGEHAYRGASFLDDRILRAATKGAWVPIDSIVPAARTATNLRPLHLILHTGHVGSTLMSRLLDDTGAVLPVREPLPLRTLAEAHDDLEKPESLISKTRFDELLSTQLVLWSRGYPDTSCVVLKATSSASRLAPEILERRRDCHAVYMGLRAEPALATLLAGPNSPIDLRGHGPERMRRLRERIQAPLAPLHALSLGELAAMSWLTESMCRLDVLRRCPGQVMAVDFDEFLADIGGSLRRVCNHFALAVDDSEIGRIASGPVLTRYSKAPEHPYGPALRRTVLDQARREHRDQLAQGLRWLAEVARADDVVATGLADQL